jgi:hypothetical protein
MLIFFMIRRRLIHLLFGGICFKQWSHFTTLCVSSNIRLTFS